MFDDRKATGNPGRITCCGAQGESQQQFPDEAPAKHLFSVDHIIFVLAVNRSELAHSIRALYGVGFDATGYLRRFFDVDFRLPEPTRGAFIDALLDAIQINYYFQRTQDQWGRPEEADVRVLLQGFFRAPELSLRWIAQAIHRLGLVFATLRNDQRSFAITTAVALIFRTIDADLYHRFHRGEVSDLDVVIHSALSNCA